jgi:pimeloyl-ACP methyl ester carboxylesterase
MAFDAPAHGHSDGKRVHAIDYAAVINEIIHRYGPIDTFIAHSFGGLGVMLALETNPQSPNTKVVLIAPATETTSAIQSGLKMLGVNNNKVQTALENEVVRISGRPVTWFSIKRAIKNVQAKVLWIHDKDDIITPLEDVEPLVSTPPQHATFHITEGLGHHKIYKDPSVIERIVSFLQLVK